ncbi:MAG: hypothetical protein WCT44_02775 [Candidatus Paceibacterota bacterium]
MSQEERELLEKSVALEEDNNKMLRAIRRSMFLGRVMTFVYWALIIGSAIGAYYFVQPYVDQIIGVYGGAKSNVDSVSSFFKNFQN